MRMHLVNSRTMRSRIPRTVEKYDVYDIKYKRKGDFGIQAQFTTLMISPLSRSSCASDSSRTSP